MTENFGSVRSAMSAGSIMSSPVGSSYCMGPSHCFLVQVLLTSSVKYMLVNAVGARVHGPEYPERSVWHLPRQCAPARATISRSLKPCVGAVECLGRKPHRRTIRPSRVGHLAVRPRRMPRQTDRQDPETHRRGHRCPECRQS